MKNHPGGWLYSLTGLLIAMVMALPVMAQDKGTGSSAQEPGQVSTTAKSAVSAQYSPGQTVVLLGTITGRNPEGITLHTYQDSTVKVAITAATEVKERKSNPFRRARNYATTQLLPGLEVEVKGHGSNTGSLLADQIRFFNDDLRNAVALDTRVTPVENRLDQNEQNAMRLSGQVSELSAVSNAARGGARAAQETADTAVDMAKKAGERADNANERANTANEGVHSANERITSLDDFDSRDNATINFKVGSAILSKEAKQSLDTLAEQAKSQKGFLIEVTGFASAEGSADYNRALSQRRADAVIRYLAEDHSIPLRRFITPFGFGSLQPVADNHTRAGRVQNRRVEVHVLVSKGLAQVSGTTASTR
jgi:outer membrane protein OmpA-like peptidoglycan-associated protein